MQHSSTNIEMGETLIQIVDNIIDKQESSESVLSKDEEEQLKKRCLGTEMHNLHVTVDVKGLFRMAPVTQPEFMYAV